MLVIHLADVVVLRYGPDRQEPFDPPARLKDAGHNIVGQVFERLITERIDVDMDVAGIVVSCGVCGVVCCAC